MVLRGAAGGSCSLGSVCRLLLGARLLFEGTAQRCLLMFAVRPVNPAGVLLPAPSPPPSPPACRSCS
jgi:hypothetical protein